MRAVAGLTRAKGSVQVNGDTWQNDAARIWLAPHRRPLGYVFQDAALFPHLDVRANLAYGVYLSEVINPITAELEKMRSEGVVPAGFTVDFGGSTEQQEKNFAQIKFAFTLAIILVYMVLASLFESLILPTRPEKLRSATRWEPGGPTLRVHAGLEDEADLIADLEAGLGRLNAAR